MRSDQIQITVDRVIWPKEDPGGIHWMMISCQHGVCKGEMWRPEPGERLLLTGKWVTYKGERQFKFSYAVPDIPAPQRDQLRYLATITKGIGPALEEAIWDAHGDEWRKATPETVKRLKYVYEEFLDSIQKIDSQREKTDVIAFLCYHGATVNMALKAWEKWETKTNQIVRKNCFELATLKNYGFKDIDEKIRPKFGIALDDPRRLRAGIEYALNAILDETNNSTVSHWTQCKNRAADLLGIAYIDAIKKLIGDMVKEGVFIGFSNGKIATAKDYTDEMEIMKYAAR